MVMQSIYGDFGDGLIDHWAYIHYPFNYYTCRMCWSRFCHHDSAEAQKMQFSSVFQWKLRQGAVRCGLGDRLADHQRALVFAEPVESGVPKLPVPKTLATSPFWSICQYGPANLDHFGGLITQFRKFHDDFPGKTGWAPSWASAPIDLLGVQGCQAANCEAENLGPGHGDARWWSLHAWNFSICHSEKKFYCGNCADWGWYRVLIIASLIGRDSSELFKSGGTILLSALFLTCKTPIRQRPTGSFPKHLACWGFQPWPRNKLQQKEASAARTVSPNGAIP